jgi:hypothetical protein
VNQVSFLSASTDELLFQIVQLIQLPKELRLKAVGRVRELARILRNPLNPYSQFDPTVYVQGSVRIGAAISAIGRDDQFDVDTMVERTTLRRLDPEEQISALYLAVGDISDTKTKKNRCVQLRWPDMHIDATPSVHAQEWPARSSEIYDRSGTGEERWPIANPEGFALWFLMQVGERYAQAVEQFYSQPEKFEFPENRPNAVLALQLIKRFRNVSYEDRDEKKGPKRPPSVLLTYFAGTCANPSLSLTEQIIAIAVDIMRRVDEAEAGWRLLSQENPTCEADLLTDRWPRHREDQQEWRNELRHLVAALREGISVPLSRKLEIFTDLFGEELSSRAIKKYRENIGKSAPTGSMKVLPTGTVVAAPAVIPASAAASPMAVSRHFGPEEPSDDVR